MNPVKLGASFLALFVVALATLVASDISSSARASPPGVAEGLAISQAAPMVGPGFTESWAKTCTTTASVIVPSEIAVIAFECSAPESGETDATQFVAIGDSGIGDPAFATRTSPVICGSGCAHASKFINAKQAYCRSDADDVVIYCWGITTTSSQP